MTDSNKNATSSEESAGRSVNDPEGTSETKKERGLFDEVAENIEESAKKVGDKATELAERLKKGLSHAFEAGTKVIDDVSHAAQEYAEKYTAESEIKKLKHEKDQLLGQLGRAFFKHHKAGDASGASFLNNTDTIDQFDQIEQLDKKIIATGKQLDDDKNNG